MYDWYDSSFFSRPNPDLNSSFFGQKTDNIHRIFLPYWLVDSYDYDDDAFYDWLMIMIDDDSAGGEYTECDLDECYCHSPGDRY